jgi:hypothetical protein
MADAKLRGRLERPQAPRKAADYRAILETDATLIGQSAHILAVARKS